MLPVLSDCEIGVVRLREHMNPVVRQAAHEVFGDDDRIRIIEPLDVLEYGAMKTGKE